MSKIFDGKNTWVKIQVADEDYSVAVSNSMFRDDRFPNFFFFWEKTSSIFLWKKSPQFSSAYILGPTCNTFQTGVFLCLIFKIILMLFWKERNLKQDKFKITQRTAIPLLDQHYFLYVILYVLLPQILCPSLKIWNNNSDFFQRPGDTE